MPLTGKENKIHVLLISAHESLTADIKDMLPNRYLIFHAATFAAGLEALTNKHFDITMLENSLPDRHWLDSLHDLVKHISQVPIVMLTDSKHSEIFEIAPARGAQDCLNKDELTSQLLVKSIKHAIERFRMLNVNTENNRKMELSEARLQVTGHVLLETESKWKSIFQHSLDGILLVDPDSRKILEANQMACRLLKYDLNDLLFSDFNNYLPQENDLPRLELIKNICISENYIDGFELVRSDKELLYVDLAASLIKLNTTEVILLSFREAFDKQMIDELRQTNELRYRYIIENQSEGVGLIDHEGQFLFGNPALEQIFGVMPGHLLGRKLQSYFQPGQTDAFQAVIEKTTVATPASVDLDIKRADNETRHVRIKARPWRNSQYETIGYFCILTDLTEIYRTKENLSLIQEKVEAAVEARTSELSSLKDSLEKDNLEYRQSITELDNKLHFYRELFEGSVDPILITDLNDNVVMVNQALTELFGFEKEDLVGKTFPAADGLDQGMFIKWLEKCKSGQGECDFETVRRTKSGDLIPVSITISPIKNEAGELEFLSFWYRNISLRKQFESELQYRIEFEHLITSISTKFTNLTKGNLDTGITEALSEIGKFLSSDRSYVFIYSDDNITMDNTHEWCATGIDSHIERLQNIPIDQYTWIRDQLVAKNVVNLPRIIDLPETAISEKQEFELEKIQGVLCVPLTYNGKTVGFIGLDAVRSYGKWTEDSVKLLNIVGELIVNALEKHKTELKSRENEERYRVLFDNAPDSIVLEDKNERILDTNKTTCETFGYSREELLTRRTSDLQPIDVKRISVYSDPEIKNTSRWLTRGKRKDGQEIPLEISITPLKYGRETLFLSVARDITDRKKAEDELRYERDKAQKYLDIAGVMIVGLDRNGYVTLINKKGCEILGYRESDILKKNWFQNFIPKETRSSVYVNVFSKIINDDLTSPQVINNEGSVVTKSGEIRYMEWHNTQLKDKDGKVAGTLSSGQDITDRILTERALRESEDTARALVNVSSDVAVLMDTNGTVLAANYKAVELYNVIPEEVKGKDFLTTFGSQNEGLWRKIIEKVTTTKDSHFWEENVNGRFSENNVYPVSDKSGNIVKLAYFSRDITEHRNAEQELRKLYQAVEQSPVSVIITDTEGFIEYVNPYFTEVSGYSADEIVGKTPNLLKSGKTSPNVYKELWDTVTSGKVWRGELLNKHKTGRLYWEQAIIAPLVGVEGKISHYIGIKEDITERKRYEDNIDKEHKLLEHRVQARTKELSLKNAELVRANKLKDEFVANISHELRTPLNTVLGMSEVLIDGIYGEMNERQVEAVRSVETSGRHLLELINDILDITKIEAGKITLDFGEVLVSSLCKACVDEINDLIINKQLNFTLDFKHASETIWVDRRRLKRIIINLLSNAAKFTKNDGRIGLTVTEDKQDGLVKFTVWDSGIGISLEDMHRLFQPFSQLDSSYTRHYAGTGVGLRLVYRLTELHGGSVTVESEIGKGSKFVVTLPKHDPQIAFANMALKRGAAGDSTEKRKVVPADAPLILIADDSELTLKHLAALLSSQGFRISLARNGAEAVERCLELHPGLIIMDRNMPIMDGLSAITAIREKGEQFSTIPIIVITSLGLDFDKQACLAAGAMSYLCKPLGIRYITENIMTILKPAT